MDPVRVSAKAIVIVDHHLLAVHLRGSDGDYYMLPGGGVDIGESLEEALHRECVEEIGCDVAPGRVVWIRDYREQNHEFAHLRPEFHQLEIMFECTLLGEPDLSATGDTRQLRAVWIPLVEIEDWPFWPKQLRSRLASGLPAASGEYLGDIN